MAVLGGVDLKTGLYRQDHLGHSGISGRMVRSRNGTPIIFEQPAGPKDFNLIGAANTGTLAGSVLQAIKDLASVAGAVYPLTHNGETYNVRFRTWEQPVIEVAPIAPREEMTDTDVYNQIVIKLQEA